VYGRPLRRSSLVVVVLLSACAHSRKHDDRLHVSTITDVALRFNFFDLGQADGMLVLYNGHTLLMDAGEAREEPDADRYHRIAQTLQSLTGRTHLDAFVVSHYHRDHIGVDSSRCGLWGLLDDGVTIDTIYDRGDVIYGTGGKGDIEKAYERAIPDWLSSGQVQLHRSLKLGDTISLGKGLRIEVVAVNGNDVLSTLARDKPDELNRWPASENDYSVALKFTYGDFELFAGGDLTGETIHRDFKDHREGYHDIESSTAERVGAVEVYRVDHHGSSHSSNACFVQVLHPDVSIISSGENNYGHPTPGTFDALQGLGRVYITGGADAQVRSHVEKSIVGGDVRVNVERGGARYSVNGRDYDSRTEQQEAGFANRPTACVTDGSDRKKHKTGDASSNGAEAPPQL
jgi:beta-lactamase superfamily II metal-dependent hydrolase